MRPHLNLWICFTPILLFLNPVAPADTIHVPGDAPTIQAEINASFHGDTVLVAPGTYCECINFDGKRITLKSEHGPESTVIDGMQNGSVCVFNRWETENSVLDGFTITNGIGTEGDNFYNGGGIFRQNTTGSIEDNLIARASPAAHSRQPTAFSLRNRSLSVFLTSTISALMKTSTGFSFHLAKKLGLHSIGTFTPGGTIEAKFVGAPGTAPVGLFLGSGILRLPLQHKWGAFYMEAPWYLFPFGVAIPSDGILTLPAAVPATPAAPYEVYLQALIGLYSGSLTNPFTLEIR